MRKGRLTVAADKNYDTRDFVRYLRAMTVTLHGARKDKYSAYAPELPGCIATGSTAAEAEANMRQALELHLEGMAEDGLLTDGTSEVVMRRINVAAR